MKRRIASLICLLLALALVLTGCGDPVKQIEKEIGKLAGVYAKAVAKYDGGEVTAGEAMGDFNYMYSMYYSYLSAYGYQITAEEISALMGSALQARTRMEIAAAHFDAQYSLTDEELMQVELDAQAQYDEAYAEALTQSDGKSDAEKDANARRMLMEIGMDYENVYQDMLLGEKTKRMEEALGAEITEITEEELLAAYEDRVSQSEEGYADGTACFELDMTEEDKIVCWNPAGFRAVKHILLIPEKDVLDAYNAAADALEACEDALAALEAEKKAAEDDDSEEGPARSVEELSGLIAAEEAKLAELEAAAEAAAQACRDAVQETIDAVYTRFAVGEDFDSLMAEFGQDPGMKVAPTMERGYCVSARSIVWEPAFRDGAMSISNAGELGAVPAVSSSGVHIIYYAQEIAPGPVPLEQIREALYAEVLENTRSNYADEIIEGWIAETNPEYDIDAFAAALAGE